MRLGDTTVFAPTDGGLQVLISRRNDDKLEMGQMVPYDYELAMEVSPN
jgi:hypothetical protein